MVAVAVATLAACGSDAGGHNRADVGKGRQAVFDPAGWEARGESSSVGGTRAAGGGGMRGASDAGGKGGGGMNGRGAGVGGVGIAGFSGIGGFGDGGRSGGAGGRDADVGTARCAALRAAHSNVVFCEDFEAAGLRAPPPHKAGHLWYDRYGASSDGDCHGDPTTTCPNGSNPLASLSGPQCPDADDGCLHDGAYTLAISHAPCSIGGNVGLARLSKTVTNFALTYALRFGSNFLSQNQAASSCDAPEDNYTGYKSHRWSGPGQETKHPMGGHGNPAPGGCVLAGGATASDQNANFPFGAGWQIDVCGTPTEPCGALPTATVGSACKNDVHLSIYPDRSKYEWGRTKKPGDWMCVQYQYENWGSPSARVRYWIDTVLVADIGADMTDVRVDTGGVNVISIENYYNGGYRGPSTAYRYEDNLVVTEGPPVACSEIGFKQLND